MNIDYKNKYLKYKKKYLSLKDLKGNGEKTPRINIGICGHVDHGRAKLTALISNIASENIIL